MITTNFFSVIAVVINLSMLAFGIFYMITIMRRLGEISDSLYDISNKMKGQ